MPHLATHIDLAWRAADRVGHRTLGANLGYYLLGSTSPDVRALTKRPREEYHFAPLDFAEVGAGVEGMLEAHPRLRSTAGDDGPAAAFVAGYITHILLDEHWIAEVYRPFFGEGGLFADGVHADVMDRALQLELDRLSAGAVAGALRMMGEAKEPIDVGLMPPDTLAEWRAFVLELLGRGFSWDRLRFMARRIAAGDDNHPAHRVAEEFLDSMPDSLDRLLESVTREDLFRFRERSVDSLAAALEEYLP